MEKSCRQLVAEGVMTLLEEVPALETADGTFREPVLELNRRTPLGAEDELPSLIVLEAEENPLNDFSSEDAYDLFFIVQGTVKGEGALAVELCNHMRAQVIKALFADRTIGGRVRMLELSDTGDFLGVDVDSVEVEGFLLGFRVHYATVEGDPFTFAG